MCIGFLIIEQVGKWWEYEIDVLKSGMRPKEVACGEREEEVDNMKVVKWEGWRRQPPKEMTSIER